MSETTDALKKMIFELGEKYNENIGLISIGENPEIVIKYHFHRSDIDIYFNALECVISLNGEHKAKIKRSSSNFYEEIYNAMDKLLQAVLNTNV
jgi:ribosome-associated translation inhibitor RaiA